MLGRPVGTRRGKAFSAWCVQTRSHFSPWTWSHPDVFQQLKNPSQKTGKCLHTSRPWTASRCLPRMERHQRQLRPQLCAQKIVTAINSPARGARAAQRPQASAGSWWPRLMGYVVALSPSGRERGEVRRALGWGGGIPVLSDEAVSVPPGTHSP